MKNMTKKISTKNKTARFSFEAAVLIGLALVQLWIQFSYLLREPGFIVAPVFVTFQPFGHSVTVGVAEAA